MEKRLTFLKDERKKTDNSLHAERDKTNKSITESRANTEDKTDVSVEKERKQADHAATTSRDKSDRDQDLKRDAVGYTIQDEKKHSEAQLSHERERSDKAIEHERTQVDFALDKERESKTALAHLLLSQERKLTDTNLFAERERTDTEVRRSSGLLSDEIAEHSKTKISLTTRDEFLAIVSHDLRNPIGAASACAEMLLEDDAYKEINPEVKYWLQFIKRNVDTSLRMISDLLDMERMAEDKLQIELKRNDISKIIREAVESFVLAASGKTILLRSAALTIPTEIMCDHDRILQVLSNLIGNALKFTPEGGTITVSANIKNKQMQVSVTDTGAGIAEDKIEKIFERFAQLGTNDRRGLGLGLYISKMLIEAHGGTLSVQSQVNEGSIFTFSIPIEPKK